MYKKEVEVSMNIQRINSTNYSANFGSVRVDVRKPKLPELDGMKSLSKKIQETYNNSGNVFSPLEVDDYLGMINGNDKSFDVLLTKEENKELNKLLKTALKKLKPVQTPLGFVSPTENIRLSVINGLGIPKKLVNLVVNATNLS